MSLYSRRKESPLSLFILKARWKLLGHISRMVQYFQYKKSRIFTFERLTLKSQRSSENRNSHNAEPKDQKNKQKDPTFPVETLATKEDLQQVCEVKKAENTEKIMSDLYTTSLKMRQHISSWPQINIVLMMMMMNTVRRRTKSCI